MNNDTVIGIDGCPAASVTVVPDSGDTTPAAFEGVVLYVLVMQDAQVATGGSVCPAAVPGLLRRYAALLELNPTEGHETCPGIDPLPLS